MNAICFEPEVVAASRDPLVRLTLGPNGEPQGAVAAARVAAPPERVWAIIRDVEAYPSRIPMIDKAQLEGDHLTMRLAFRISFFTARFGYSATITRDEGRSLEVHYESGEPRDLHLRFDLVPTPGGDATVLYVSCSFDLSTLGWLVKLFLRHHPEIRYGVFSGSSLALLDSIRQAAEAPTASPTA
jgi:ribosome-associated toxin RatA of RatAB toxin-antitoxin module